MTDLANRCPNTDRLEEIIVNEMTRTRYVVLFEEPGSPIESATLTYTPTAPSFADLILGVRCESPIRFKVYMSTVFLGEYETSVQKPVIFFNRPIPFLPHIFPYEITIKLVSDITEGNLCFVCVLLDTEERKQYFTYLHQMI